MKYGRRQGVKFACTTALYLALAEIIADPTTCRAQSRLAKTTVTFESAITQDVDSAQDEIANPTYDNETSSACSGAFSWAKSASRENSFRFAENVWLFFSVLKQMTSAAIHGLETH